MSAVNAIGEGNQSQPALEVLAARVPDAPTDIASVSASSEHITFDWTEPYDGGSPINFYKVFWNQGPSLNTFEYLASTPDPINTFTMDYSLNPGDTYQFYVQAVSDVGDGDSSLVASFIAASLPDAPGKPYAVAADTSSITVAWSEPNANGSPISNYKIYYSVNSAAFVSLNDAVGTSPTFAATGLSTGNNYKFKVIAVNGVGEGSASEESDIIIAASPPESPTGLSRVYGDGTLITVEWEAPLVTGGIPIVDYKVYWDYGQGGAFVEIADTTTGDLIYTKNSDVIEGLTYQFKVVAVNAVGESPQSDPLSVIAA